MTVTKDVYPCNICGKDAIGCYSPDIDVKGLCFCKKHQEKVALVYTILMQGTPEMAEPLMKGWKFK